MFRGRKWQRDFEKVEEQARAAAREAVTHVVGGFMTHPDEYAPKACIVAHSPTPGASERLMFKLAWDDRVTDDYFVDGDLSLIVREVTELQAGVDAEQEAASWAKPQPVDPIFDFRNLPGIFQDAFASYWTGLEIPVNPMTFMWAPSYGASAPVWGIREFPAGIGDGPAVGKLGWGFVPKEIVGGWYRERGW